MAIYFGLYGVLFFCSIWSRRYHDDLLKKHNKRLSYFIFAMLFLLLACRHPSMGMDLHYGNPWTGYIYGFHYITSEMTWADIISGGRFQNYEWGYIVFNKIVGSIFKDTQFFLACVAFVCLFPVYAVISKKSESPVFSTIIYMGLTAFLMTYSGLRQAIAIALCFYSILFVERRQKIRFVLCVLIAFLFHSSAILWLLAYPLFYLRMNIRFRLISITIFPLIFLFGDDIVLLIASVTGKNMVLDYNGAWELFLLYCCIYIFGALYAKDDQQGYLNIFYIACLIQSLGYFHGSITRMAYYFSMPLLLLIPNMVGGIQSKNLRFLAKTALLLFFVVFGLYNIQNTYWAKAAPYIPFWGKLT